MPEPNNNFPNITAQGRPIMTDQDFLTDCLTSEKYITQSYATALHEMSHHALYKDIRSLYTKTEACQRKLYDLMFEKGWYSYKTAGSDDIQEVTQTYTKYKQEQFPSQSHLQ